MTSGEDFRTYMKAVTRDQNTQNGPHLSETTMIRYYRGELSEAEREATQAHLVACAECIALFRSVSDFLEPAHEDEEEITSAEMDQQWQSLRERAKISAPERIDSDRTSVLHGNFTASRDKSFLSSRLTLALAACLLISLGASGWLAWREQQSRRQSQEVAAELERKQRDLEQRLAQLTVSRADEIKREREQRLAAEAERDRLQDLLAEVRSPVDEIKLYPFTLSSERGPGEELKLSLSTAADVRLLIAKPGAFDRFDIELVDHGGRIVRKFQGLRPTGVNRTLNFKLSRGALSPGKYRLRLLGRQEGSSVQIVECGLVVRTVTR